MEAEFASIRGCWKAYSHLSVAKLSVSKIAMKQQLKYQAAALQPCTKH